MQKNIFILWFQGFIHAPRLIRLCLRSWKYYNPDWNIIELDSNNLNNYINFKEDFIDISGKNIPHAAKSDIVRIILLKKYGGLWVDATTFCTRSLNEWLDEYIQEGVFGFKNPGPDRLLSSWFLYGEKDNYVINQWFLKVKHYWTFHNVPHTYFWFHGTIFGNLYAKDIKFRIIWNNVPKFSAGKPHFITNKFMKKINMNIKNHIDTIQSPLYKLSHKINNQKFIHLLNNSNSIIYTLKSKLLSKTDDDEISKD
jgi:hypothetical protein